MPPTPALDRAGERIRRLCDDYDDARALRLRLVEEIRRAVPFDAYAWLLTDPETEVGCAPLADVPWLAAVPRQIRLKYLTPVNRWTSLRGPVALLRREDDRRARSLVWREMLGDHGVNDAASMVFRDRFGCWAFLELWRIGSGDRFNHDEADLLARVAPPITTALRRCQGLTFTGRDFARERVPGPAVLLLSPLLEVRAQTGDTQEYLRRLVPPDVDRPPVPAGAYNVAAQLLAVEADVDAHPAMARVHLSGGLWLTLRAARLGGATPTSDPDIAVTIETSSPVERAAVFVRAFGLTLREAELVTHLIAGADTHRIAEQMFLSEHTVQDHLKSIFTKTGTRTRRTLVARVAGR